MKTSFDNIRPNFDLRQFSGFFGGLKFLIFVKYVQITWGLFLFRIQDSHFFDVDMQGKPLNIITVDMAYFCLPVYCISNAIFLWMFNLYVPSMYFWYRRAVLVFLIIGLNPYIDNAPGYMMIPLAFSIPFFLVFGIKLLMLEFIGLFEKPRMVKLKPQSREYSKMVRERRKENREEHEKRSKKKKDAQRFHEMNRLTRELTIIDNRGKKIIELETELSSIARELGNDALTEEVRKRTLNKYNKVQLRLTKMREGQERGMSNLVSASKRLIPEEVYVGKKHSMVDDLLTNIVDCLGSLNFDGEKVALATRIVSRMDHFRLCTSTANYTIFFLGLIAEFVPASVISSCYDSISGYLKEFAPKSSSISADPQKAEEIDPNSIVTEREGMKEMFKGEMQSLETIFKVASHPLSSVIKKIVALVVVLSLSYGFINKDNMSKIVEVGLDIPKKVDGDDVVKFVSSTIKYIMKSVPMTSGGIDWSMLWEGTTKNQKFIKEFADLKYQTDLYINGDPNRLNDETPQLPLQELMKRLEDLRNDVSRQMKFKQGMELAKLQRDYVCVDTWCKAIEEKIKMQCLTEAPAILCAVGSPGTGKTLFLQHVLAVSMAAAGMESGPEYIGTFNPNDKYDMHCGKTAIIIDDMLQVDPQAAETNEPLVLIRMGNNTVLMANMPGLEQKGRVVANPSIIGCTSNDIHLNPTGYINHPDAFRRRFNFIFEIYVKPEYCLPSSSQIDPSKALGHTNIWNFKVGKYIVPSGGAQQLGAPAPPGRACKYEFDKDYKLVPAGQGHWFDLLEFCDFLIDDIAKYYAHQREIVKNARRIGKDFCVHEVNGVTRKYPPGSCKICKNASASAASPPPTPAVSNADTTAPPSATASVTPPIVNAPAQGSTPPVITSTVSTDDVQLSSAFVGQTQSRVLIDFSYALVAGSISIVLFIFYATVGHFYMYGFGGMTVLQYVQAAISTAFNVFFNQSLGFRVIYMYLVSLFGHIWYKPRVESIVNKIPSKYVRRVYSFLFITFVVVLFEVIAFVCRHGRQYAVSFGKKLAAKVSGLCVRKAVDSMKQMLDMYQYRIAIILALAGVLLVVKLKTQGNVQFGNQPDTWSAAVPYEVVLNDRRTTSYEDAMRVLKNCLVSVRVEKGLRSSESNAIPYRGNYYLMNAHLFEIFPDWIHITRYDRKLPQSNYKQRMSKDYVHIIPDTDIAVVFLPRCMRNSDFSGFFTDSMPSSAVKCLQLYKDPTGKVEEKAVYAVAQPSTDNMNRIHIRRSFVYIRDVFNGLCGAPLISSTKFPTVIGMHWSGDEPTRTGCATFICKSEVEDAIKNLEEANGIMRFAEPNGVNEYIDPAPLPENHSFIKLSTQGNLTYIGKVNVPHIHRKSDVTRTELHDVLKEEMGFEVYPPLMSPHWKPEYDTQVNLAYKSNDIHIPPHLLKIAYIDLQCKVADYYESDPEFKSRLNDLRVLSFEEGLNGTGMPGMEKMKLDTSMGMSAIANGGKKSNHFSKDENGNIIPPEGFKELVLNLEEDYAQGKTTMIPWRQCKKDEVKTKVKYARIFSMCPVEYLVLMRMYFLCFCGLIRTFSGIFETVIGMNVYSRQWDEMVRALQEKSSNRLSYGDYKFYDQSVTPEELIYAFRFLIFLAYFSNHITERMLKVMWGLASDIIYSLYIGNGHAFLSAGDVPSGVAITVILNNIVNMLRHRVVYYFHNRHISVPIYPYGNPDLFHKHVVAFFLGDDCITSCDTYVELSAKIMADILGSFGITYTDAEKKGEVEEGYGDLEGASFLKRKIRKIPGISVYVAPLDITSIYKGLMAYIPSNSVTPAQQLADSISTASREMFFHGPEEYDRFVSQMKRITKGKDVEKFITEDAYAPYETKLALWQTDYFRDEDNLVSGEM